MTDTSRLSEYIEDYFPEPIYSSKDIEDWAKENVPAWKVWSKDTKEVVIEDWENFIAPKVEHVFRGMTKRFAIRIKKFLGKLWKGGI